MGKRGAGKGMKAMLAMVKPRGGSGPKPQKAAPVVPLGVNDHAAAHGLYERDGNRGTINRGGTAAARWIATGQLSETQQAAIALCQRLWQRVGQQKGLVQDLLKAIGQPPISGWSQQEALDELQWLKKHIPTNAWVVFENVCRFDEAAGVAGSSLATNSRSAVDAARVAVCFVADAVAMRKGL